MTLLRYLRSLEAAVNSDPEVQHALWMLDTSEEVPSPSSGLPMDCVATTTAAAGLSSSDGEYL